MCLFLGLFRSDYLVKPLANLRGNQHHEVTFGIPRKIGAAVEQALTYALFDQKRSVTAEMVLKVKNLEG